MIDRLNSALEGRYTVERELGQGGMATVYLATDLKHNRRVAVKVLKEDLAAVVGEERFLAEIETTAQLQHPHILPLFDSGAADGFLYYAMPYVEGETLRDRLSREVQLPVEHAIELVQKVAAALDYAHDKGIVHRDIKPENILLSSGEPLIADFGIALAVSQVNDGRRTETGISLGTPFYMSPEQAAGDRSLDPRSDIYALGCVLQELLTGEPPFSGANAQAVLARILTTRPTPVTSLRPTVPLHVESAINKALEKLPADRFTTAKEFRTALSNPDFRYTVVERTLGSTSVPTQTRIVREGVKKPIVAAAVVGALAVGAIAGGAMLGSGDGWGDGSLDEPSLRTTLDLGEREFSGSPRLEVVVSPDGSRLAYIGTDEDGREGIWWRTDNDLEFRLVPGSQDADGDVSFSPDGDWIAWTGGDRLVKAQLLGGQPVAVVPGGDITPYLFDWSVPGTIIFWGESDGASGVFRIADNGGTPQRLFGAPEWENTYNLQLLPDESGILFSSPDLETPVVGVYEFSTDSVRVLVEGALDPTYVPETGHLLYADVAGALWAAPFDLRRRDLDGEAKPVLSGLRANAAWARYSVSSNGTLVLGTGWATGSGFETTAQYELVVVGLDGAATSLDLEPRFVNFPRWSPDGAKVAWEGAQPGEDPDSSHIFVYDVELENIPRQITAIGDNFRAVWSPNGRSIAFSSRRAGSDSVRVFLKEDWQDDRPPTAKSVWLEWAGPFDWPVEDLLVMEYAPSGSPGQTGVYTLPFDADSASPQVYYTPEHDVDEPMVSPDGNWVVYNSAESGEEEIHFRRFPDPGQATRVSQAGGQYAVWSPSGDTIYYSCGPDLCGAEVQTEPGPDVVGTWTIMPWPYSIFDLHPDGDRFITRRLAGASPDENTGEVIPQQHIVIHNWFSELRRIMGEGN